MIMSADLNKELEAAFLERNETLRTFYHAAGSALSEEEIASLTPILNSLKDQSDRYSEIEPIAEGGEKRITMVYDKRLDRRVAMARAVRSETLQDQEQFLREARLTANLAHPNIMPVYNMGIDSNGVPFFTMELVMGDSLKIILRKLRDGEERYRQHYTQQELLSIFLKICDAIAYAHSRGVLHLDIKPDNIKVGEFGEVFVCDWGLARVINRPDDMTRIDEDLDADMLNDMTLSGTMKGTPGFMAPEQTLAYSEKTPMTDIYALGAVLYMILTYELPVRGSSANEVVQNTREGKIISPRRRRPDRRIPGSLEAVSMKALALDPENRYQRVGDLRKEIRRFMSGKATNAENAGLITVFSLLIQRHSRMAFLILFFFMSLAGLISLHLLSISREKAEAVAAQQRAERNFALYQRQQEVAKKLSEDLDDAVLYTVKSRDFVNAASMIQVLELGLTENLDPTIKENLLIQKGTLHFILQQFNAAIVCFEMAGEPKRMQKYLELSRKYAEIKPQDTRRLNDRDLANLFYEFNPNSENATLFYMYYHHMRRHTGVNPEDHIYLVGAVLDSLNQVSLTKNRRLKLKGTDEGYHLDLSGTPYGVYTLNIVGVYHRNVLEALRLKSLDISNTPFKQLSELRGMELKELKMTGIQLSGYANKLSSQFKQLKLEKLIVSKDSIPMQVARKLRAEGLVVDVIGENQQPPMPPIPGK